MIFCKKKEKVYVTQTDYFKWVNGEIFYKRYIDDYIYLNFKEDLPAKETFAYCLIHDKLLKEEVKDTLIKNWNIIHKREIEKRDKQNKEYCSILKQLK
jgi:hypothetical protein